MKILTPSPAELTRGRAATPIAFIRAIVGGYRRRGMDPASALGQAQIPPALLDDPQARVTAAQMEVMSGVAMQELDDEALGWFSRRLPWGSYGMLCRASVLDQAAHGGGIGLELGAAGVDAGFDHAHGGAPLNGFR